MHISDSDDEEAAAAKVAAAKAEADQIKAAKSAAAKAGAAKAAAAKATANCASKVEMTSATDASTGKKRGRSPPPSPAQRSRQAFPPFAQQQPPRATQAAGAAPAEAATPVAATPRTEGLTPGSGFHERLLVMAQEAAAVERENEGRVLFVVAEFIDSSCHCSRMRLKLRLCCRQDVRGAGREPAAQDREPATAGEDAG